MVCRDSLQSALEISMKSRRCDELFGPLMIHFELRSYTLNSFSSERGCINFFFLVQQTAMSIEFPDDETGSSVFGGIDIRNTANERISRACSCFELWCIGLCFLLRRLRCKNDVSRAIQLLTQFLAVDIIYQNARSIFRANS